MTADAVGGVWRYVIDLASALQDRGIEPLIAVLGPALTGDQRQDAIRRGLHVVENPGRLEWMEDPWRDVDAAGEWLLGLARAFSPDTRPPERLLPCRAALVETGRGGRALVRAVVVARRARPGGAGVVGPVYRQRLRVV